MVQLSSRIAGMLAILSVASTAVALPAVEHDGSFKEQVVEAGDMVNRTYFFAETLS
jgi:hypothetical protein